MANTKSSIKDIRKTATRTAANRTVRSRIKTLNKKWQTLAADGQLDEARSAAVEYISALDKAVKTKRYHPNKASREKSKISVRLLNKTAAG